MQVPTGSIEAGEPLDDAVRRELSSQTGITAAPTRRIDVYEWEDPDGRWHRRHVYQLTAPPDLPDRWEHRVPAGDDQRESIVLCHWLPLEEAEKRLCKGLAYSLKRVVEGHKGA